jgi:biotin carboxyl carrier protein
MADYVVRVGDREFRISVTEEAGGLQVRVGDEVFFVDFARLEAEPRLSLILKAEPEAAGGESVEVVRDERGRLYVWGLPLEAEVVPARLAALEQVRQVAAGGAARPVEVKAPMPGLVVRVGAEPGQVVRRGHVLVVLQAMKMENELSAPRDGTVREVRVRAGQAVDHGEVLAVLE